MLDTSKLFRLLGKLEFYAEYYEIEYIKECYNDLCSILDYPSIFKQEEQQEEQEKEFIGVFFNEKREI